MHVRLAVCLLVSVIALASAAETTPPPAAAQPLALGKPGPIDQKRLQEIQSELMRRLQADQGARRNPGRAAMGAVDQDNVTYLKELLAEVGWIDCQRFGVMSSTAAFLIVQHSGEVALMTAVLPEVEKDVKAKRIDGQMYSLLYDRLELMQGRRQRYGSQVEVTADKLRVLPLQDRAHVEELRKEIGLQPLSDYLATLRQQNGGKEVVFSDP